MTEKQTFLLVLLCVTAYILGGVLGIWQEQSSIINNWCEQVHEGQMQGEFCITPENVAVPRPEWSK